ncbi:MAG: HD domain-containing protein [Bacteroidia bacterium]|nr:HD domain-containing protein [Bacteroidia bacterium]
MTKGLLLLIIVISATQVRGQRVMPRLVGASNPGAILDTLMSEMASDRVLYNLYNDSIFMARDKEEWVNFIERRAKINQLIYDSNHMMMDEVKRYFLADSIHKPLSIYDSLRMALHTTGNVQRIDPFLGYRLDKLVELAFDKPSIPDSIKPLPHTFFNLAGFANSIYRASGDTVWSYRSYEYAKKCFDPKYRDCKDYAQYRLLILASLSTTNYVQTNAQTEEEFKYYLRVFDQEVRSYTDQELRQLCHIKSAYSYIKSYHSRMVSNLIRNAYLNNKVTLPKEIADSLMRSLVDKYQAMPKLDGDDQLRCYMLMQKLGDISCEEAVDRAMKEYRLSWDEYFKEGKLTAEELDNYIKPLLSLFYLIDISELPYSEKRKLVYGLCVDLEDAYLRRNDQQYNTGYIRYLNTISTYDRVTKYLTPEERVHFLMTLNVATQVSTYAHSVHVGELAKILTQGIIENKPELLVGMLGCKNKRQVQRDKERFLEYMGNAALYHDLGKISISSVINNDFRPIFKEEFDIMHMHPELGLKFLELAPQLEPYRDVMLGHHKWYNGEGGYPATFDNVHSPYRTLIDIITICDVLQAATERVGRNYKASKSFDTALSEMRTGAGVQYNPELFSFIESHPRVAEQLNHSIEVGWRHIYYDIYAQFFKW